MHFLVIPDDPARPAEVHETTGNFDEVKRLTFGHERYHFDALTFRSAGFILLVDDEGLFHMDEIQFNDRASQLAQAHSGLRTYSLVGSVAVIGFDAATGEWADLSPDIVVQVGAM